MNLNSLRKIHNRFFDYLWGPKRYKQIFYYIKKTQAKNIMEIGTWNGGRALEMINKAKKKFPAKDISYFGFDLFEGMDSDIFKEEISKWPPSISDVRSKLLETGANINLYKGNTKETLREFVEISRPIDFIFIDGGHSVETINSDWGYVQKIMNSNTIVIFDDYWNRKNKGAKPVVDNIDKNIYSVKILPIVDKFKKDDGMLTIQFALVKKIS